MNFKGMARMRWLMLPMDCQVHWAASLPLLLGEDFHVNYHLSTMRDECGSLAAMLLDGWLVMIPARSAPPEQLGWVGESEQSELHAIMASLRKSGERGISRPTHSKTSMPLV